MHIRGAVKPIDRQGGGLGRLCAYRTATVDTSCRSVQFVSRGEIQVAESKIRENNIDRLVDQMVRETAA